MVERFISKKARLRSFSSAELLSRLENPRDIHWIGKALTVELVLRFMEERWTNTL